MGNLPFITPATKKEGHFFKSANISSPFTHQAELALDQLTLQGQIRIIRKFIRHDDQGKCIQNP